ncbi:hypothetical protein [Paraburkholderia hospita]|jgi:hypothetical protein|uniref:hypothetical protein n=1 Tax=Paraburkholderia hospita TaxID=169430 RepID=UPI0008A7627F|nr:hypothetical protein [Paraburkholderia hospita]SEI21496.1 hypothetical protein SAMN05192544_104038 [Paraburkholderia hospita]
MTVFPILAARKYKPAVHMMIRSIHADGAERRSAVKWINLLPPDSQLFQQAGGARPLRTSRPPLTS